VSSKEGQESLERNARIGGVWILPNTLRCAQNVLTHHKVFHCCRLLDDPSARNVKHGERMRRNTTYSAMVSDQPSPSPPASVVCKHLPDPPPVIRFVIPWVISCTTMSFSIAPSRLGFAEFQINILHTPGWPLYIQPIRSAGFKLQNETYSGGVAKLALLNPSPF
jgi:hypothetical protein